MSLRRLARAASALTPASSWTCPACSRTSLLPQAARQAHRTQRRLLHSLPKMGHDTFFQEEGVPGLLSPDGYRIAWTDYQSLMVQKLNELTAGEPYENEAPKHLAIRFARDPMYASLFNYASMAFNNHFFFNTLAPEPRRLRDSPVLEASLLATFGSVETLQATMLDTAAAMFGPGFVWLVWVKDADPPRGSVTSGAWRILTTYLAGTPFAEAGYRQQGIDMATNNADSRQNYLRGVPVNSPGTMGTFAQGAVQSYKIPPGSAHLVPILCVNTWEHVWLRDFGVAGKRRYLADWWSVINWQAVESAAAQYLRPQLNHIPRPSY